MCAFLVNLSMFHIIDATGPVSSTVIGHLKNSIVIGLGWVFSDQSISHQSILGIFMALIGMTLCVTNLACPSPFLKLYLTQIIQIHDRCHQRKKVNFFRPVVKRSLHFRTFMRYIFL